MELALEVFGLKCAFMFSLRFNPCYYGIGFRSQNDIRAQRGARRVSILVIMELALEAETSRGKRFFRMGKVSILVIMELALEEVYIARFVARFAVSILVIMELALEV